MFSTFLIQYVCIKKGLAMANDEKKDISLKKILTIIKEILEIIIAGLPEDEAIAQASKKYNVSSKVLKDALKEYRA